jgi:hypothetical protein
VDRWTERLSVKLAEHASRRTVVGSSGRTLVATCVFTLPWSRAAASGRAAADLAVFATLGQTPHLYALHTGSGVLFSWPLTTSGFGYPSVVAGRRGVVFFSGVTSDGKETEIFAVSLTAAHPTHLGTLGGYAVAWAVADAGDRLLLLTFANGLPAGVTAFPLPAEWQGPPVPSTLAPWPRRGLRWYGADANKRVWIAVCDEGAPPEWSDLAYHLPSPYYALLLSPDASAIYVVGFWHQVIDRVDVSTATARQVAKFGDERYKRPPCAAALSPQGNRLFVLGNRHNAPAGILVFDTTSWQRLAHFPERHGGYDCMILSSSGDKLFASTGLQEIVVLDALTGAEEFAVVIESGDVNPEPLLTAVW